jgi:signal transduction histidine kinase
MGTVGLNVVEDDGFGRRGPPIEAAVFFCCAEALQNATKHAGRSASVTVQLGERDGWLHFTVDDDGQGFDTRATPRGLGLDNMADRIIALGGRLDVDSGPGRGTRVIGRLPTGT